MPQVAQVAVDKATSSFDKLFTYRIPRQMEGTLRPGCRVMVPFGAGNKKRQGMVFALAEAAEETALKPVFAQLDENPVLSDELLALSKHLRDTVFCTYYEAVRLMVPAGLDTKVEHSYTLNPDWEEDGALSADESLVLGYLAHRRAPAREKAVCDALGFADERVLRALYERGALAREEELRRRVLDDKITMVRLCGEEGTSMTQKQRAVYEFLQECGAASLKECCYYAAVTRAVVDNMQKKGLVEYYEREVYRNPYRDRAHKAGEEIVLSGEQQQALSKLEEIQNKGEYAVSLLFGVTGSGKTQVFLKLAQQVVQAGQGVLVLVPEIALTPQTIGKFHSCFGGAVAVIHSALSLGERLDEFKRIRRGEASVVVGTRSAVFAPIENLGLIIIDEEQEQSYKSEKTPRFHARDVAKWRAHYHGTQLLLASATPSVESYYQAKNGKYALIPLRGRYTGSRLPDVYIIDTAAEGLAAGSSVLSQRLCDELYHNLQAGEQSILLLNRRGYHTLVKCKDCSEVARCPNCSVSLTYHSANDSLCCHYCGYIQPRESPCKECGGQLTRWQGAGTQRVEEELRALYPQARVLRMDMDTTMHKFSHEEYFGRFAAHEYDIMVGTQMVAKGLNFPDVTLVGVLGTDQWLFSDDFRSFERTFGLLTQVVGRAGRSEKRGRAFVQTMWPQNPVIEQAAAQHYEQFFAQEISTRRLGLYPPFCDVCALGITSPDEEAVVAASQQLCEILGRIAAQSFPDLPLRVLGPSDFALYKMGGKYRRKLILKCRNNARTRALLRQVLAAFDEQKQKKKVTVFADMYYDNF